MLAGAGEWGRRGRTAGVAPSAAAWETRKAGWQLGGADWLADGSSFFLQVRARLPCGAQLNGLAGKQRRRRSWSRKKKGRPKNKRDAEKIGGRRRYQSLLAGVGWCWTGRGGEQKSSSRVGLLGRAGEELVGASRGDAAGSVESFITSTWQRASLTVRSKALRLPSLPFATRRDSLVQPLAPCGKASTYIRGATSLDA